MKKKSTKSHTSSATKTKKRQSKASKRSASTSKKTKSGSRSFLKMSLDKFTEQIGLIFSSRPKDTVSAIKMDHKSLRSFLDILKDTDRDMSERRRAYELFSALLESHSSSEEQAVYNSTDKMTGHELHLKVAEGLVEHDVASALMGRIAKATEAIEWSAHVNVLAESVKHHLDEEERDLLPKIRKQTDAAEDQKILTEYLKLRAKTQAHVSAQNAGVLAEES